jgi:hypothetical protein
VHGDPDRALELFETAISSLHRAGDVANLALAFGDLAVLFDRMEQPDVAATLYGVVERHGDIGWVVHLPEVVDHVRAVLGESAFDDCVTAGAAMDLSDATQFARDQIQRAQQELAGDPTPPAPRG